MAELSQLGEWVGPGEELTANALVSGLPDSWHIIAARSLPGADREDIDFIVVGDNCVFVLEEKHWGPSIVLGDQYWIVKDNLRRNPVIAASGKARKVASLLKDKIKNYRDHVVGHAVRGGVVLSYPKLNLLSGPDANATELVFELATLCDQLQALDAQASHSLAVARHQVVALLLNEPARDAALKRIGDYKVGVERPSIGRARCFAAEHLVTGAEVELRCYPKYGWGGDDAEGFLKREAIALDRVADLNRAWRVHPPFEHEKRGWFVVPVIRPRNCANLVMSHAVGVPERDASGAVDAQVAAAVVEDGLRGLAAVHAEHIVHRGLAPSRIWMTSEFRVLFSDFYLARLEGEDTIVLFADDDVVGAPYCAPECAPSPTLAVPESDVYALAFCLSAWWMGDLNGSVTAISTWLEEQGSAAALVLLECLTLNADSRPTALEAAQRLESARKPAALSVDFTPGQILDGRYEVIRELGEGASATAWLAMDRNFNRDVVLKAYHDAAAYQVAAREVEASLDFQYPHCARLWDRRDVGTSGYVVQTYVPGLTLSARLATPGEQMDLKALRTILHTSLDVLGYIHSVGMTHGDLSGNNIIVSDDWVPTLIDFGLAGRSGERAAGGTLSCVAPEVLAGKSSTAQSDLYSLAATLLSGLLKRPPQVRPPFPGVAADWTPLPLTDEERDQLGGELSAVAEVLFRAVRPKLEERIETAGELLELLQMAKPITDEPKRGADEIETFAPRPSLANPTVEALRRLYRGSALGNAGNRGLDDDFAKETYVRTQLDAALVPQLLRGELDVVLLTGNPGDGKTSFFVMVRESLVNAGGAVTSEDSSGWRITLDGHDFAAVYDASEAYEDRTSDDLVFGALTADTNPLTSLIAINDGRLHQFVERHGHAFPEIERIVRRRANGRTAPDSRIAVIDLKQRALASLSGSGLGQQIADSLTSPELWALCDGCSASATCPILSNARALRGPAREAFGELLLLSHLRGHRRATFRDVRSALSWLITGDRGCDQVHEARSEGLDLALASNSQLSDLAFATTSADYLINEWSELDPALVCAPTVGAKGAGAVRWLLATERQAAHRQAYFGLAAHGGLSREQVRGHRYLSEFEQLLSDPLAGLDRVLLGVSRIAGAPGFVGNGMAVGESHPSADWAVLKIIPRDEFSMTVPRSDDAFIETLPDRLTLRHNPSGACLDLPLDTMEVVLRCADGEVMADLASEPIRQEIASYALKLRRQPSEAVQVVDPSGSANVVRRHGAVLELMPL